MKKEDIFLVLGVLTIIGFFVGIFYTMQLPPETKEQAQTSQAPAPQVSLPPENGDFNPDYANLSDDEVKIADIAIGNLLNNSEGITPPMIAVKSFEQEEFSNTALGCPEEGKMYSEVITPGYRVILSAQGKDYDYRLDGKENVVLCEQ